MITKQLRDQYKATIGIECHVQLKTKTKLFSGADNDARQAPPNTLINHIDFGLPGALPVLNEEAINLASRAAFALGSSPQKFSKFDRKHYFYPDLPMGYQITQYDQPIVLGGQVSISVDGQIKTIGITRAHLEADAGKSTHPAGKDYSLVDLNRAGTPLLEIVSEPDMHSALEAKTYARELYLRMKYAGVSEANLYYGNMRFDVNVSVSKTDKLGTRSETKNLNSFRAVEKAVEYETNRQIVILERGQSVSQETRGWNDAKQVSFSQRSKEDAHDYRYMPDPDLPPVTLSDKYIASIAATMPPMPEEWRQRLAGLGVDQQTTELMIEAQADVPELGYLEFIEKNLGDQDFAKWATNRIINVVEPFRASQKSTLKVDWSDYFTAIYELSKRGQLSSTKEKELMESLLGDNKLPADITAYAQAKGYIQVSDTSEITKIVEQVLADNPKAAKDVLSGEAKATQFLVGQVMKASKGKANPSLAQDIIKKHLAG